MAKKVSESGELLFVTDSLLAQRDADERAAKTPSTGQDGSGDPFWNDYEKEVSVKTSIRSMIAAMRIIPPSELLNASYTYRGAYITRVSPMVALFQGWKFVKNKKEQDRLDDKLADRLFELTVKYNLKWLAIQFARTGAIFGRALIYKQFIDQTDESQGIRLRVIPILDTEIIWDDVNGAPQIYRPIVRWGFGTKTLSLDPKECILFVWDEDELGNGYEGIPALISCFDTITNSEELENTYTNAVRERGVGVVDVLDKQAKKLDDLVTVRQNFKLGDDRAFVHGPRYEMQVHPGLQSGFNYDEIQARITKNQSMATGYPGMAMEGVQVGAVTGSETDQDNRAQMYRIIQERVEQTIIAIYKLLDPKLKNANFELQWDFEVKMDKAEKAQVMAQYGQVINDLPDLINVNQALQWLDLPPEEDGELFKISEWRKLYEMSPSVTHGKTDEFEEGGEKKDPDEELQDMTIKEDEKESVKRETEQKREIAKKMVAAGDSYSTINLVLKKIFKSGLNNSTIKKLRSDIHGY